MCATFCSHYFKNKVYFPSLFLLPFVQARAMIDTAIVSKLTMLMRTIPRVGRGSRKETRENKPSFFHGIVDLDSLCIAGLLHTEKQNFIWSELLYL